MIIYNSMRQEHNVMTSENIINKQRTVTVMVGYL